MFPVKENIYVSKLRLEMEPTDIILKRLITECYTTNTQLLFSSLAEQGRKFWHAFPNAMIIIMEWANQLSDHLSTNVQFFEEDLKTKIWKNFLCRLSLDSWLILGKGQHSHGNKILKIFMLVVRDIIYSQLPLKLEMQTKEYYGANVTERAPNFSNMERAPATPIERIIERAPNLATQPLYGQRPAESNSNPYGYSSDLFGLPRLNPRANVTMPERIPEETNEESDEELKELRKSTSNVYLPKSSDSGKKGMIAIKLKKSHTKEESSNKSRSRKKSHKKHKKASKKESDSESEESEDD